MQNVNGLFYITGFKFVPLNNLIPNYQRSQHCQSTKINTCISASTALAKKTSARLRELATVLGAISRNLADVFLANAVQKILVGHFQKVNTLAG